jgi:transposase
VPQERVSVRKMKEALRLSYELKLTQTQIARSCNIGQSSVFRHLKRFKESGLTWPLPGDRDDRILEELLFAKPGPQPGQHPAVDFVAVDRQLQAHKHTSLQLLWEEYRGTQPEGYRYSYYCEMYRKWKAGQNVVMRQDHRPARNCL